MINYPHMESLLLRKAFLKMLTYADNGINVGVFLIKEAA